MNSKRSKTQLLFDDLQYLLSRKKKAYYIGWHGHGNLGDEILYDAYRQIFDPYVHFYDKQYKSRLIQLYIGDRPLYDIAFLGGGTLINRGANYLNLLKRINYDKFIVFGTGVANPEYWTSVKSGYNDPQTWTEVLNAASYVGVRGPLSKMMLEEWGVKHDIKVLGDPALFLADSTIAPKCRQKILGVNLGVSNGLIWGGDEGRVLDQIVELLQKLKSEDWSFKFFPVWDKDIDYIREAIRRLDVSEQDTLVTDFLNLQHFLNELRQVDVFIGEKLHSVVLAAGTYTPVIMLEYRPKCRDFMESLDLGTYNVRCDQIEVPRLLDMCLELYMRQSELQEHLYSRIAHYRSALAKEAPIAIQA